MSFIALITCRHMYVHSAHTPTPATDLEHTTYGSGCRLHASPAAAAQQLFTSRRLCHVPGQRTRRCQTSSCLSVVQCFRQTAFLESDRFPILGDRAANMEDRRSVPAVTAALRSADVVFCYAQYGHNAFLGGWRRIMGLIKLHVILLHSVGR